MPPKKKPLLWNLPALYGFSVARVEEQRSEMLRGDVQQKEVDIFPTTLEGLTLPDKTTARKLVVILQTYVEKHPSRGLTFAFLEIQQSSGFQIRMEVAKISQ